MRKDAIQRRIDYIEQHTPFTAKHEVGGWWFKLFFGDREYTFTTDGPLSFRDFKVQVRNYMDTHMHEVLAQHFPQVLEEVAIPGVGGGKYRLPLWRIVILLNDTRNWTREQIADWLESLDLDLTVKESNADGTGTTGTAAAADG